MEHYSSPHAHQPSKPRLWSIESKSQMTEVESLDGQEFGMIYYKKIERLGICFLRFKS